MKRSLIVLNDGREVFSGNGELPAIKSLTYSAAAVSTTDFFYGSACAATVEVSVIERNAELQMMAGDEFIYYEVDQDGNREKIGKFICTTAKRSSPYGIKISAHDYMTKFDVDISMWLAELTEWPYTMKQLLDLTADQCGVQVDGAVELINGDHPVQKFITSLTGRKMIQWICEANACFASINENGVLVFRGLTNRGNLTADIKKAFVEDYSTKPIERVVVKQTEDDVGTRWPDVEGETYEILRNPLLAAFSEDEIFHAVQAIAQKVVGLTYTPATVEFWEDGTNLKAGDVFSFQLGENEYTTIVFSEKRAGTKVTTKSTGNSSRSAPAAVWGKSEADKVQGRVAEIKVGLEKVSTELKETTITAEKATQKVSEISQTANGINAMVNQLQNDTEKRFAQLQLRSDGMEVTVGEVEAALQEKADAEAVADIAEHFIFDENGLTISDTATGMGIQLSEEAVEFIGGSSTTRITPTGLATTDAKVEKQFSVGGFTFTPRTTGNLSIRWTAE